MKPSEQFSRIARPKVQRSTFDRSRGYKTTFDAGKLIPFFVDEALPGDDIVINPTIFARLNTPIKPLMDNIFLDVHFFACPIRLIWDNFVKMMGEQDDPSDSTDFIHPTITAPTGGFAESSIYDYLGIPTKVENLEIRADFNRAINLIYNQWFRDENLQDSVTVTKGDGPDSPSLYTVLPRGKRKDYLTSCLPFAQKADAVTLSLGDVAPVLGIGKLNQNFDSGSKSVYESGGTGATTYSSWKQISNAGADNEYFVESNGSGFPDIRADLTAATAITINDLREASQMQYLFEVDARGGTRYIEHNLAHFGVVSPDSRLQRPEYIGGFTTRVNVSPIAQNSASESGNTPQGNLSAIGTASHSGTRIRKSFTEHEVLLGFISARADLNYQQGLDRMWSRSTRFDHYFPAFAHLGEQAVLNKEIYAQGTSVDDDVFGYNERWSEYRYAQSKVTGLFRSNATASLDVWHLSQEFGSLPTLNSTFIEENPPLDRVVAVPAEPHFMMDSYIQVHHTRPMPVFSTPGSFLTGRF